MVNKAKYNAKTKDLAMSVNGHDVNVKWFGKKQVMMGFLGLFGITAKQFTAS
jgi:hypothetical protein